MTPATWALFLQHRLQGIRSSEVGPNQRELAPVDRLVDAIEAGRVISGRWPVNVYQVSLWGGYDNPYFIRIEASVLATLAVMGAALAWDIGCDEDDDTMYDELLQIDLEASTAVSWSEITLRSSEAIAPETRDSLAQGGIDVILAGDRTLVLRAFESVDTSLSDLLGAMVRAVVEAASTGQLTVASARARCATIGGAGRPRLTIPAEVVAGLAALGASFELLAVA
jgi:hypothetical protein